MAMGSLYYRPSIDASVTPDNSSSMQSWKLLIIIKPLRLKQSDSLDSFVHFLGDIHTKCQRLSVALIITNYDMAADRAVLASRIDGGDNYYWRIDQIADNTNDISDLQTIRKVNAPSQRNDEALNKNDQSP
jgi:hypothetical protein